MSARTAGRRRHGDPADIDDPDQDDAEGIVTRLAVRMVANPAMSGGLVVMALTAVAVVSNALFLQRAQHPEPWFATRPAPVALAPGSDDIVVPDPRPRASRQAEPPLPRTVSAETPSPVAAPGATPTLVANLQRALNDRGLYRGKIDGISGTRTRAAITAYEQSQGLEVTGQPSARILDHITTAAVAPANPSAPTEAAPLPALPEATIADLAGAPAAPEPVETVVAAAPAVSGAAMSPQETQAPASEPEMLSYPPRAEEPAPVAIPVATNVPGSAASAQDPGAARTLSVQKALNLIGYGPVPEDGVADDETIGAIRRFELDNGLPITGAAGDTLIKRLVAIGAMEAA